MKKELIGLCVRTLVRSGEKLPPRAIGRLHQALGLVEIGSWLNMQTAVRPTVVAGRYSLFELALPYLEKAEEPLYLEFGVAGGASLKWWSANLRNPEASLIGFDSFQGLPHDWSAWQGTLPKGSYAQAQVPQIPDSRVRFEIGLFEDTVPRFQPPAHDALVITMDADLYSSTALVLRQIRGLLKAGTFIYFDDFPMDEKNAFADFCSREGLRFEPVAMECQGFHWMFRVVA